MENALTPEVLYTLPQQLELGRKAARSTLNPFVSMLPAYKRAVAEHGPLDWMTWTLGYCRELCGALSGSVS
jgi:hypothetical protein